MPEIVMDIIYLHQLKVDCVIGAYAWEKQLTQTLSIDLDLGCDIKPAAASDQLADTLNYKEVSKRIQEFVGQSRFELVEKLAEEIADILLGEFSVAWCRVKINKFGALQNIGDVGVIIERGGRA